MVLTNNGSCFKNLAVLPFAASDHHLIEMELCVRGVKPFKPSKFIPIRDYRVFDVERVSQALAPEDWNKIVGFENIDECVECFNAVVTGMVDLLIPEKLKKVKYDVPPWCLSPEVRSMRRECRRAHREALQRNTEEAWNSFRKARNARNKVLRRQKGDYIRNLAADRKENVNTFWKTFSYMSSKSKTVTGDSPHSVHDFAEFFAQVPKQAISNLVHTDLEPTSFLSNRDVLPFHLVEVEEDEINNEIGNLDVRKATGVDRISAKVIKMCRSFLLTPITALINKSFVEGIVPHQWKLANVTPIPKSNDVMAIKNFRPISVLPILSKLLERVVCSQLTNHLKSYDLLSPYQSAFRQNHSTQDVLISITDCWRACIDQKKFIGAVFLDMAKAFDCVDHGILLKKLPLYGIQGNGLKWFKDYLTDRKQRVCVGIEVSRWCDIDIGVPQGSVLGPVLFSIYVNDLIGVVRNCEIHMYADDTTIYKGNESLEILQDELQRDLNNVSSWLSSNRINVNVVKTVAMLIGSKRRVQNHSLQLYLNGINLSNVSTTRLLGVWIDNHLSWKEQVNRVNGKVRARLNCIRRLLPIPLNVIMLLYKTYVLPLFDYCDVAWAPSSVTLQQSMEKLHTKALNLIGGRVNAKKYRVTDTLSDRVVYHTAIVAFRVLHDLAPSYLQNSLTYTEVLTTRTLRNQFRVYCPQISTEYGRGSFYFRAVKIWNRLPTILYDSISLKEFKSRYILDIFYY